MNKETVFHYLTNYWNTQIPFTKMLGMEITKFDPEVSEIRFKWRDDLMGNNLLKILHGGVTATVLDMVGGVVIAASLVDQLENFDDKAVMKTLQNMGTIDLRTDYLRPGRGEEFIATARIIRHGSRVAVARMEMHNEKGSHLAFGTGTYMIG